MLTMVFNLDDNKKSTLLYLVDLDNIEIFCTCFRYCFLIV